MPIEPIKIPQNVYIEDRIVGPLTLKQVIIVTIGGGFSYALWAMLSKTYGAISIPIQVMVWLPALLSAVFAFVKINDLTMLRLCLLFIERINKPAVRTWTPRRGIVINVRTFHTGGNEKKQAAAPTELKQGSAAKFEELSSLLDQPRTGPKATETIPSLPELMKDEPIDEQEEALENPNVIQRAVDPTRIKASPIAGTDAPPSTGSVSLFRDISPAH